MKPWRWTGSLAAAMACAGFSPTEAVAQTPAPGAAKPAAMKEGDLAVISIAGQQERQVKVLRVSRSDDGSDVAEVRDPLNGLRYTLPVTALHLTTASAAPRTAWAPASPTQAPATTHWNRLSANPAPPSFRGQSPVKSVPVAKPALPKPIPLEPVPVVVPPTATIAFPPVPISPLPPVPVSPLPPVPVAKLAALEPALIQEPPVLVVPTPSHVVPTPLTQLPAPIITLPESTWEPRPPVSAVVPIDPGIEIQSLQTPNRDVLAFEDVAPLVNELNKALRPSVRETAATALADGRYGSKPVVKAMLAKAAESDPAPSVRAHCVLCLSNLGYHEPNYIEYLKACAAGGGPELRSSAKVALAKLTPR